MREKYFDIERGKQFPCFCQGCLVGKTKKQMSKRDTRYCLECQPSIESEYALIAQNRGRPSAYKPIVPLVMDMRKDEGVLLHTKNENAHEYQNPSRDVVIDLGGRPQKDIPVQLIHKLSKKGLAIRPIVQELKRRGHSISAMTISRVLSGKRNWGGKYPLSAGKTRVL